MRETIDPDPNTLALSALVWILEDDRRTERLLALTGLDGEDIRSRLMDPALLAAVLDYLAGYEPDLIACAQALGHRPEQLIQARERLSL